MAGLLAIIAHDRRARISREEIEALVREYQLLRGENQVRHHGAGEWARVARLGPADDDAAGHREGEDWAAAVGALHITDPLERVAPADLDGQFAAVRYDAGRDALEAFSDPFGMQQLYRADRDGRTYLSTSSTVLARHLRSRPDADGARLYVRTGKQLGPITLWQGVERLDPATLLRFTPDGHSASTYWQPWIDPEVRAMDLSQTADRVVDVSLAAVERGLRGQDGLWADLTGGYDSRLTTALLDRAGLRFRANTAGEEETVDVRIAREVARAGGFPWRQERLPEGWRLDRALLDRAVAWGDGTLDVLVLGEVLARQAERRESHAVVVNGGGGEHLGNAPWMQEFHRAGRSREVNFERFLHMRMLPPAPGVTALFGDQGAQVEQFCREWSREVLGRRAAPFRAELNTSQLDAMYVYRAISHFGAFRSAFEAYVHTEMPFYYKDIFSAGFSAQHRWRNGHRLHRAVIERLNPRIAAVETERGGPAELTRATNLHRFLPYYGRLARTAVRKVRGRAAPAGLEKVRGDAYRDAVGELRAQGLLDPATMHSGPLYDARAITDLLDDAQKPDFEAWTPLARVVTVELTLRAAQERR